MSNSHTLNSSIMPIHKIINIKQVCEALGLSRSTIYEMLNPKSKYFDSTFPKPINLTMNRIGWVTHEVNEWVDSKLAERS